MNILRHEINSATRKVARENRRYLWRQEHYAATVSGMNKIRKAIIDSGLTNKQIANTCQPRLCPSTVENMRKGNTIPLLSTVLIVAKNLGVNVF